MKIRKSANQHISQLMTFSIKKYGLEPQILAWEEFIGEEGPDIADYEILHSVFQPWYLFKWKPRLKNSIAFDYIVENLRSLDEDHRNWFLSCMETSFSFYEVKEVARGKGLHLEDMLTQEKVFVVEKKATQNTAAGEIMFAKVTSLAGNQYMETCFPWKIPSQYKKEFLN